MGIDLHTFRMMQGLAAERPLGAVLTMLIAAASPPRELDGPTPANPPGIGRTLMGCTLPPAAAISTLSARKAASW